MVKARSASPPTIMPTAESSGTTVLSAPVSSSKDEMTIGGLCVIDGIDVVASLVPEEDVWQFEATETCTTETQLQDREQESIAVVNYEDPSTSEAIEGYDAKTGENAGEERVTAKSKPMMNMVSRYSVRDPNVHASTASESPVKTRSESQNVSLSPFNEQQPKTGRLVKDACSSSYS